MASFNEPIAPPWAARGTYLPLEADSEVVMRDWEDVTFDRPEQFAADLQVVGLPLDEVASGMEILRAGQAEASNAVEAFWSLSHMHTSRHPKAY